jgi:predicted transcriptional regulator
MKVVSFKADEELVKLLEDYAKKHRLTKGEVIRRALKAYIKSEQPFESKRIRIYDVR